MWKPCRTTTICKVCWASDKVLYLHHGNEINEVSFKGLVLDLALMCNSRRLTVTFSPAHLAVRNILFIALGCTWTSLCINLQL